MILQENARYQPTHLTPGNYQYVGSSVASEATYHLFPSIGIGFDLGRSDLVTTNIPNFFITHGHWDHCGGLAGHMWRRNGWGLPQANYFASPENAGLLNRLIDAVTDCSMSNKLTRKVTPLAPGETHRIGKYSVSPFDSFHRIPCQGYRVTEERRKLRAHLVGRDSSEIIAAKSRGEEIHDVVVSTEIAFPGDTNVDVFTSEPWLYDARVLILECTGLDDEMPADGVYRKGHIHIQHLLDLADKFNNEAIILTHFSARYSPERIRLAKEILPEQLASKVYLV